MSRKIEAASRGASQREQAGRGGDQPERLPDEGPGLVARKRGLNGCGAGLCHRSVLKAARTSSEKICGSSQAAKCPPLAALL